MNLITELWRFSPSYCLIAALSRFLPGEKVVDEYNLFQDKGLVADCVVLSAGGSTHPACVTDGTVRDWSRAWGFLPQTFKVPGEE